MEVTRPKDISSSLEGESVLPLPSLRKMRRKLSRTDYEEYRGKKIQEVRDPVAYFLAERECFEKELQSDNPYRRARARVILDSLEISMESARTIAAGKAELLKDEQYNKEEIIGELREAALRKGPTLFQKLRWKAEEAFSRLGVWLGFIPKTLVAMRHWYEKYCQWLVVGVWGAALMAVIIFSLFYSLGTNLFFSSVLLALVAIFSFSHEYDFKNSWAGFPWFAAAIILLLLSGVASMLSWQCFAPQEGWAVVTRRGAEIVQVINSEEWLMRSPRLWQGEKMEFINLTNEKSEDHLLPYGVLFGEVWLEKVGEFKGRSVLLRVTAQREVVSSGLRRMVEENRPSSFYRGDIQDRVGVILESFPSKNPTTALLELQEEISRVRNDVFKLKNVNVFLDFK